VLVSSANVGLTFTGRFAKAWGKPGAPSTTFSTVTLEHALSLECRAGEAMLTQYAVIGGPAKYPRLAKNEHTWRYLTDHKAFLHFGIILADVDCAEHAVWSDTNSADVPRILATVCPADFYYSTRNGLRVGQVLSEPFAVRGPKGAEEYELRRLERIFALERLFEPYDLKVDHTRQWNISFFTPHTRSKGRPFARATHLRLECDGAPLPPLPDTGPGAPMARRAPPERVHVRRAPEQIYTGQSLPYVWTERARRIGESLRTIGGTWHELFLGLAGLLVQSGAPWNPPELLGELLALVSDASGVDSRREDRRAIGVSTAQRWAAGLPIQTLLTGKSDEAARLLVALAVEAAMSWVPPAPKATLDAARTATEVALRDAQRGLTLLQVPCGVGKTFAAEKDAASRETKTGFAVMSHRLAKESFARLVSRGVPTQRRWTISGDNRCLFQEHAQAIAGAGLPASEILCDGRSSTMGPHDTSVRCVHYTDCLARPEREGPDDARVLVSTHAAMDVTADHAGRKGKLLVDEPPELVTIQIFNATRLREVLAGLVEFGTPHYVTTWRPILEELIAWAETEPCEWSALESARQTIAHDCERSTAPKFFHSVLQRCRSDIAFARRVERVGNPLRFLGEVLRDPDGVIEHAGGHREGAGFVGSIRCAARNARILEALRIASKGTAVVMGADANSLADDFERMAMRPWVPIIPVPADAATVTRIHVASGGCTRSVWEPIEEEVVAPSFAAALRAVGELSTGKTLVYVFLKVEAQARAFITDLALSRPIVVEHYGRERGTNDYRAFDTVATVGDPRLNGTALEVIAAALGRPGEPRTHECALEVLAQCHGRLRAVNRPGEALTMIHVGFIPPRDWDDAHRVELGPIAYPPSTMAAMVEDLGGVNSAARAIGVARSAVSNWCSGKKSPSEANFVKLWNASEARK